MPDRSRRSTGARGAPGAPAGSTGSSAPSGSRRAGRRERDVRLRQRSFMDRYGGLLLGLFALAGVLVI
ncbi:MAG: hypothetical protein ACXWPV_07875, partial [Candidatus Limnocylindrales bacterium]